jgi:hypothetical protein
MKFASKVILFHKIKWNRPLFAKASIMSMEELMEME